jgi:hypothetical protein
MRKPLLLSALCMISPGCASYYQLPYYEPPTIDDKYIQLASVGGTFTFAVSYSDLVREGNRPTACADVAAIDGKRIRPHPDCLTLIPISPGDHMIVVRLRIPVLAEGTATLLLNATAGHDYVVSAEAPGVFPEYAQLWISDVTSRTPATKKKHVSILYAPQTVLPPQSQ